MLAGCTRRDFLFSWVSLVGMMLEREDRKSSYTCYRSGDCVDWGGETGRANVYERKEVLGCDCSLVITLATVG